MPEPAAGASHAEAPEAAAAATETTASDGTRYPHQVTSDVLKPDISGTDHFFTQPDMKYKKTTIRKYCHVPTCKCSYFFPQYTTTHHWLNFMHVLELVSIEDFVPREKNYLASLPE